MPRASSSISSESPSQPGNVRWALPGSLCVEVAVVRRRRARPRCTRRTRSSRRAATRVGVLGLVLDGQLDRGGEAGDRRGVDGAAADVALLAAAVHQRGHLDLAAYDERADAVRAADLVPGQRQRVDPGAREVDRHRADAPAPRRCAPGCRARPRSRPPRRSAGGCRPRCWPTSPRSARPRSGSRSTASRKARRRRGGRCRSTGSSSTSAPSRSPSQCSGSSTAWCSIAVVEDRATPAVVRAAPRPVEALEREVVGLGAAGGEDHLAGSAVQRLGDRLARLLHDAARVPPGGVQRRRVAGRRELRGHRLDRRREHRRGGGMVEVDGHRTDQRTAQLPHDTQPSGPRPTSDRVEPVQPGVLRVEPCVRRRAARPAVRRPAAARCGRGRARPSGGGAGP